VEKTYITVRKRKSIMSKEQKQRRVYELAEWARNNRDKFQSINLWWYLDKFAKQWGVTRETVRKYLPEVRKLLTHKNATFEQAKLD
jgi:hypothetical protein